MEEAVIIHAGLGPPSSEMQEELSRRLGMDITHCYQVRDTNNDFKQLMGLHLIKNKILLVHSEERGLRIALLTRFLVQVMRGNLIIVAMDEYWDRKQGVFVQTIEHVY